MPELRRNCIPAELNATLDPGSSARIGASSVRYPAAQPSFNQVLTPSGSRSDAPLTPLIASTLLPTSQPPRSRS